MIENTQDLYVAEMNNKAEFQKELAAFAMKNDLKTIVETGYGVSTIHFLYAMKHTMDMEAAKLYSIDPSPWYPKEIVSPQFEHIKAKSLDAMKDLFLRTGPWDLFLHDGNHDILCQTYEYNFAWGCLKPGGFIASDDHTWGGHNAWQNFLANHDLKAIKMGSVEMAQKPLWIPVFDNIEMYHEQCIAVADNAEYNWLAAGNKNSDVEWVRA
jgi:predicted O-methyltransferase YrrM